jgi:hypothetical protein
MQPGMSHVEQLLLLRPHEQLLLWVQLYGPCTLPST